MLGRLSNLIKTVRPDGKEVDYLRYGSGHLHGMLLDKERIVDYERDDNHREVKRHWAQDMLQTTAYDAAGRLANQHTQSGKYVKKSILNRDYQYDGANQLINIKDSRKGELSYRYDPIGRLINAKGPLGEETFSFDPAHNILSKEHSASSTYQHQTENTLPSGISKVMGNLLRHIAGSHFDYDQRGNLIKKESAKGIQTFDWDGFNQMKSSTFRGARAGSRLDTQYRYDVFGRRIGKRVVDVRTKEVLEQTLYDWDGLTIASEDRIGEQLAVQAQIRKDAHSEIRKLSSEVQYLYEDGEFVPLVQYTNSATVGLGYGSFGGGSGGAGSSSPAVYHYVNDQIGTPQILMNADQEVVWEAQSKAWGDTIILAPVSDDGVINNHRFQGQYFDAESELHYNTFRYYDPEIGRFISLDPIGLWGGLNNYQYAPNPVEWVDPLGWENKPTKIYVTYTKLNEATGEIYSGRTSGYGDPEQVMRRRDKGHHMNKQGFGPAELDKCSCNKEAIRGREQHLIEYNGKAKSQGGTSGNAINGISKNNSKRAKYLNAAIEIFGELLR
ncbi:RHS repeat-associated core domain-containing protein [Taylorella equigenitalis]|uniref:RHS repeat domain-containing protein n=1 Tax=Taylorella equigenitalis TaxID=29575 RepID=UPI00240D6A8F|nr:RHS repeat-associated core domain-containing protein [Taylorella equigenitalis]WFE09633.1 RHS repeat-associated core domain-containing protein [Taylorella equigenitalis]WNW26654.1 RHS repeat-associated core domain-containing protein [Taylorella equigenitalis]